MMQGTREKSETVEGGKSGETLVFTYPEMI